MVFDRINGWAQNLQNSDTQEPALFRYLVQQPAETLTAEESLYVMKYRRAFQLELVSLLNIPVGLFCYVRCLERFNPSFLRRRSYKAAFALVLTLQVNLMGGSIYLRRIKKYPFENKLLVSYMQQVRKLEGGQNGK